MFAGHYNIYDYDYEDSFVGLALLGTHLRSFERYHPWPPTASPSQGLGVCTPPKTPIPIISGTGQATNFQFCMHIYRLNRNKSPLKILGKSSSGHSQRLPKIFRAPICRAHRVVIFATAQLSCCIMKMQTASSWTGTLEWLLNFCAVYNIILRMWHCTRHSYKGHHENEIMVTNNAKFVVISY